MKELKRNECPFCGNGNWSGREYCQNCSGELYNHTARSAARDDAVYTIADYF